MWILFLGASLLSAANQVPGVEPVFVPLVGADPLQGSMAEWLMTDWTVPMLEPDMAAMALGLALGVVGLLVVPKLLILADALRSGRVTGHGGAGRAAAGVGAELAFSAMIAPILLMFQARAVAEILSGRDGGWPVQARDGQAVSFAAAWAASWWITSCGAGIALVILTFSPVLLIWFAPVCLPLVLRASDHRLDVGTRRGLAVCHAVRLRADPCSCSGTRRSLPAGRAGQINRNLVGALDPALDG